MSASSLVEEPATDNVVPDGSTMRLNIRRSSAEVPTAQPPSGIDRDLDDVEPLGRIVVLTSYDQGDTKTGAELFTELGLLVGQKLSQPLKLRS